MEYNSKNFFKANKEQIYLLIETKYKYLHEKRSNIIAFIITDKKTNIIGHLIAEKKNIPPPLKGEDWFIWNIYTELEFRRQGIASILLKETIKYAKKERVLQLLGSCTNTPAQMFWDKNMFCSIIYGQKIDNTEKPEEHGNYPHMIFYRLNNTIKKNYQNHVKYDIIEAKKEHLDWVFDDHITNDGLKFFHDKKDDINGFAAIDNGKNLIGIATIFPYKMGSPLEGLQWMIPYIYVHPDLRRQGIARALINDIIIAAKKENIKQLTCLYLNNNNIIRFLSSLNFAMCSYYVMRKDGKYPISAALRIN
jgi:GNAT superfamily N-acetyltransferase